MREIEFKGIRIDNGEWVYGNLIMEDDECYISTGPLGIALDEGYWANSYGYPPSSSDFHITNIHEVIPKTVCQFTGLLDQKKVKIYEGDIVIIGATSSVIKYFPKYGMFGLTGKSAYKKFDESEPMGSGGSSTRYKPYVLSEYYQRRMEVIGNIHDKHQQKQALIDTMRGDEEIGLYDDNPKKITDMNEVEFLATKLGCPDLINANRNQLNSAARQAISYYLKKAGYHERDIAKMHRKSRATIYHHIKTFEALLDIKDSIAISLWEKLTLYPIKQSINQLNKPKNSNIREK